MRSLTAGSLARKLHRRFAGADLYDPPADVRALLEPGNRRLRERAPGAIRILVADHGVPAADRDAGSLRMTWLLRLLRSLGGEVTLFPADRARTEPYSTELEQFGVEICAGNYAFADFVAVRGALYDLVLLSRPHVAAALLADARSAFPEALIAYDTVDLHFLRSERRSALSGGAVDPEDAHANEAERFAIEESDLTITVTQREAEIVQSIVPGTETAVLPTIHESKQGEVPPFDGREDLLFIGGFRHRPNVDAVLHFVESILPAVRESTNARLWVIGGDPPDEIRRLQSPEIVITGQVPDVDNYFHRARVFVSPLRFGAGMKGKNGQAMALGLPVVTTSIGAEGMDLRDEEDALIRDDPAAFAAAVVRLYRDPALWSRLSDAGRAVVRERWSPDAVYGRLSELVSSAMPERLPSEPC